MTNRDGEPAHALPRLVLTFGGVLRGAFMIHARASRALRGVYIIGEGSGGCSYSYRKWQMTGSSYWRSRYHDCRNG